MTKIVVIGGTGLIGSRLAGRLVARGHDAVAASPGTGVSTLAGEGLAEALTGADVVVDVSNRRRSGTPRSSSSSRHRPLHNRPRDTVLRVRRPCCRRGD